MGQYFLDTLFSGNQVTNSYFGFSVSGIGGDVNGDNIPDLIVGARTEYYGGSPISAGRAYILNGSDGTVIHTLISPNEENGGQFGQAVAGINGDVNGDGIYDVIVGAFREDPGTSPDNAGRVYVFSGSNGNLIHTLISPNEIQNGEFGHAVSGNVGDVNNDGVHDILIGAHQEAISPAPIYSGMAYIFSGANGNLLQTFESQNKVAGGRFGCSVSGLLGDVNSDSIPDVIIGAYGEGPVGWGKAYILSGQNGSAIHTLNGPVANFSQFGISVSGVFGDVNSDSIVDVIVGAPMTSVGGAPFAGKAYIFSGNNGALLQTLTSPNSVSNSQFGWSVSGLADDVNGNGAFDVIIGASGEMVGSISIAGRAYLMDGNTGGNLFTMESPNVSQNGWFGHSVSSAHGDLNNDGSIDLIIGAMAETSGSSPNNAGRAYSFSSSNNPLPIGINNFITTLRNDKVHLNWWHSDENTLLGFLIEKQSENQTFETIGKVDNPDNGTRNFEWIDSEPKIRFNRYRIVATYINGAQSYSATQEIYFNPDFSVPINVFPNPVDKDLYLSINASFSQVASLYLQDKTGRNLLDKKISIESGSSTIALNLDHFSPGVYCLTIYLPNSGSLIHKKVLKK